MGWVRPGGRLIYCTCSVLPDEGEGQLAGLLERSTDIEVMPLPEDLPETWHAKGGGVRLTPDLWPERGGLDGFFIVALRKLGAPLTNCR